MKLDTVADHMRTDLITLTPDMEIVRAVSVLMQSGVSGACVIACVGSLADWPQPLDALPADFAVSALWFPSALVLRGRLTDPDDRPPKSL